MDVKVNLSNRDNTYLEPHSQAPAVSLAKGSGGGLRTYSRIPLHLRGKTPGAADAAIDSTKSKHANIANREKISTDQTVRKTSRTNIPDSCPIRADGSRHSCA